jgi:hypothetical protein
MAGALAIKAVVVRSRKHDDQLNYQTFGDVLTRFSRGSRCANAHDYVYAILPLHRVASRDIVPDYAKPLSLLLSEVTKYLCRNRDGKNDES